MTAMANLKKDPKAKVYDFTSIEAKWHKIWDEKHAFEAKDDFRLPKYYPLIEFPYPSGEGLHVGHPRSNTALDIVARKRRMEGYNVLYPIGWDAFGLPTENYAVKHHIHPKIVTRDNVAHFRQQLKMLGFSFDWSREVNTTDPKYYKWTQWIFLQLYKHGLAYKAEIPINWCPSCKIGLANEEVVGGNCERCGAPVERRVKAQWMLRITDYAQKLLDGLDTVDYIERVRTSQRNWIGRSDGAEIDFALAGTPDHLRVFTTRPDTIFGATYMVLAPEHDLLDRYSGRITNWDEVAAFREQAARKSELERTELTKEKVGLEVQGLRAINPATGKEIPLWISDYVLVSYGTGAIMGVPGHDTRDWEFAKKYGLPIIKVIEGNTEGAGGEGGCGASGGGAQAGASGNSVDVQEAAYTDVDQGTVVNSGFLNGLQVKDAIEAAIRWVEESGIGKRKINYKLRDWVFSRQRYWGEPIPLVHCDHCGWVPVPEDQLPVTLPDVESYEPTDTGESPLSAITDWVNTTCPKCGGPAQRETDTMPNWAGSSWYFIRYTDPHNDQALASKEKLAYWMPVDWYNGGMEHTTLHLLYSRFWYRFLYDIGVAPTPEPYQKRTSHGMILGENHEKMSKSRGNVINPDDLVANFGADTFRVYEMFIGAFDQDAPWSAAGVGGAHRFLQRVWAIQELLTGDEEYSPRFEKLMHKTVKKVSADFESLKFNTAIAALMTALNEFVAAAAVTRGEFRTFLQLLNPVAPHITEELWKLNGFGGMLHEQPWPTFDPAKTVDKVVELPVAVNGKFRGTISVPADAPQEHVRGVALAEEHVRRAIEGKKVINEIYRPGKMFNLVVK